MNWRLEFQNPYTDRACTLMCTAFLCTIAPRWVAIALTMIWGAVFVGWLIVDALDRRRAQQREPKQ